MALAAVTIRRMSAGFFGGVRRRIIDWEANSW
jgi:hypothetical protein